jgi:hypothetical protein
MRSSGLRGDTLQNVADELQADALETDPGSVLVHLESLVKHGAIRVKEIGEDCGVWYWVVLRLGIAWSQTLEIAVFQLSPSTQWSSVIRYSE